MPCILRDAGRLLCGFRALSAPLGKSLQRFPLKQWRDHLDDLASLPFGSPLRLNQAGDLGPVCPVGCLALLLTGSCLSLRVAGCRLGHTRTTTTP